MGKRHAGSGARSLGRDYLSLREAVMLADVPEKPVRKDLETGVLTALRTLLRQDGRICFRWHHVYVLAAAYGNEHLNGRMRKAAIECVERVARDTRPQPSMVALDKYVGIDWEKVRRDVSPRVDLYAAGLERIEERADVLGGDAVFKGTRLPVAHIAKMIADGESAANVLEDFPSLTLEDVEFSKLYLRAHPPIGRPKRASDHVPAPS